MGAHFERGRVLYRQGRYDQAIAEFRGEIAEDPGCAHSRTMIAHCMIEQGLHAQAARIARGALEADPELPAAHLALARALLLDDREEESLAAARDALELDPGFADAHGACAAALLDLERPAEALEAARAGLACDPGDSWCRNLEGLALVKLGRGAEAGETLLEALADEPENAFTHANRGWALLRRGQSGEALEHFAEALRLDPDQQWAREGLVEALKARNPLYRWLLAWSLWLGRLSPGQRWTVVLAGLGLYSLALNAGRSEAWYAHLVRPLAPAYLVFVALTWVDQPLFDLMLLLDRRGRRAMTRLQRLFALAFGSWLALAACTAVAALLASAPLGVSTAAGLAFLAVPLAAAGRQPQPAGRILMLAYTLGAAALVAGLGWPLAGRPQPVWTWGLLAAAAATWIHPLIARATDRPARERA